MHSQAEHNPAMAKMRRDSSPAKKTRTVATLTRVSPDFSPVQSMESQPLGAGVDVVAGRPSRDAETSTGGSSGPKHKKLRAPAVVRPASPDKGLRVRGSKA